MNLVLVESPTKSKTIKKFLGREYQVLPTMGHVRDLPEDRFGLDLKKDFAPEYVIPAKAKKTVAGLKKASQAAANVILATDEDREGEAIAWHLAQVLGLGNFQSPSTNFQTNSGSREKSTKRQSKTKNSKLYQRIVFHEITGGAIAEALKNPRAIDMNLVDAQQARRALDRLVGYKLSPFLWKKVAQGLSAGRVQSVAVRLICDREEEIRTFKPQEYWTITATLFKDQEFAAQLWQKDGKALPLLGIKTRPEAEAILQELAGAEYRVSQLEKKETTKNPLPPFATSTLQQTAWQRFHFPAKFTMSLAQQLYEKGWITYHRTDSLNLSALALDSAKEYVLENYGRDYWPGSPRRYKTKSKTAQEAHEAIRPTDPSRDPPSVASAKEGLPEAATKLYTLVWQRFLACQMSPAVFDATRAEISARNYLFQATGQALKFDGFLKVYPLKAEETDLPGLVSGERLELRQLSPQQHFTEAPHRYSEATLVKTLEKFGIGRPSTYAPILDTIQGRGYVKKDEKKLFCPTEVGELVNKLLVSHFPQIVDQNFTAQMEESLDRVSAGQTAWQPLIRNFSEPFLENLKTKEKEVSKKEVLAEFARNNGQETKTCPLCQSPLVLKISRYGRFYACSRFPECKYTEHVHTSLGVKCPQCAQGEMVERRTHTRKIFYGCARWPQCNFALWDKPTGEICPACQGLMVKNKWGKVKCGHKECSTNAVPTHARNPLRKDN